MRIKSISFYLITGLLLAPSAMNADDFKPLRVLNDSLPEQWTYNAVSYTHLTLPTTSRV